MSAAGDRPFSATAGTGADPLAKRLLVAALAIGVLRFLFLGQWSLWLDEAFTLADARHREGIDNPLGYALFDLVYSFAAGRPDELLMRLPAALFGYLVIPATYLVFRVSLGQRAAAVAALIVACSSWHLYWSQNARFYTLAQLLVLVGGGLFARGIELGRRRRVTVGLLFLGLAPMAHPSALLLGVPLLLLPWTSLWLNRPPTRDIERVPWNLLSLCAFLGAAAGAGWGLDVWSTYQEQKGGGSTLHLILSSGYFVTPTLGAAFAWGAWSILRDEDHPAFVPLGVALPSLLFAVVASLFVRVSAQYVFAVLPWIAAVAAAPLVAAHLRPRRVLVYVAIVVLPGLIDSALYFARNGDRPRWREAYAYVFEHRRDGDLVFGMEAPVGEYYWNPAKTDLREWHDVAWLDRFRLRQVTDWRRYDRRTWYVVNLEQLEDWAGDQRTEMLGILEEDCELRASFTVPLTPRDLNVFVYLAD